MLMIHTVVPPYSSCHMLKIHTVIPPYSFCHTLENPYCHTPIPHTHSAIPPYLGPNGVYVMGMSQSMWEGCPLPGGTEPGRDITRRSRVTWNGMESLELQWRDSVSYPYSMFPRIWRLNPVPFQSQPSCGSESVESADKTVP